MSFPTIWAPVVAGAVGGGTTLLGAAAQRRFDVRNTRRRDREKQSADAAAACDARLRTIDRDLLERSYRQGEGEESGRRTFRILGALDQIELDAALLTEPYRDRVRLAVSVLRNPRNVAEEHWQEPSAISYRAREELHAVLASAIAGDPPPPKPTLMLEYAQALDSYNALLDDVYAEEVDREDRAHRQYLDNNPELADEIRAEEARRAEPKRRWTLRQR